MAQALAVEKIQELPQVFGRYLLLKRLSRGGMGEIFLGKLGEIQGFEKPVIIKKILPQLSADQEFIKRFIDEAQVAIKLNHANIAPVYEVGKVDGDYFLALEYIEGRDLRRLIARCDEENFRLPPDLCMYIGRELANGLGYAHRRIDGTGQHLSLVHCDISPPNVMVSFEGEVKIIDFGIAKSAIRIAGSNPNIGFGKFGYMAPEQLLKGGIVDRRTDIYAAGVVLYELLTGERLFEFPEGADYRQIARIVTKGEFIPPSVRAPGLDRSFDTIVGKALASKASERYQTAEEFRDAIQAKLSQMNPTISSDALASLMRRLCVQEIISERALIASTRSINVDEFREQLTGSIGHTVTFARSAAPEKKRGQPASSGEAHHVTARDRRQATKRTALLLSLAAFLLSLGAFGLYRVRLGQAVASARRLHGTAATPGPGVAIGTPLATGVVVPPAVNEVKVVSLEPPPKPVEPRRPRRVQTAVQRPSPPFGGPDEPDVPTPQIMSTRRVISDEMLVAKFRTVKAEYETFQRAYGARLDGEWQSLAHEIVVNKPDRAARVNVMLDSLRRDMAKVRSGG